MFGRRMAANGVPVLRVMNKQDLVPKVPIVSKGAHRLWPPPITFTTLHLLCSATSAIGLRSHSSTGHCPLSSLPSI